MDDIKDLSNEELLALYKEEKSFVDYLQKNLDDVQKKIEEEENE